MGVLELLQEPWAWRALFASTLVGITCGILGAFIVLRNMSLIGDALSHAVLPGVVVAFLLVGYQTTGFFVGSVIAGLVCAVAITWIQQAVKTKADAVIGIVFTAMFSLGVIGISSISRTGVHLDLKDFLFGNVLGVSDEDLTISFAVLCLVIVSVVILYRYLFASTFQPTIAATMGIPVQLMHYSLMLLLSFAVVAAMQTVGVILVVAMLITPASTALLLKQRLPSVIITSAIIGMVASITGLLLSIQYELPPGPAIAVTATMLYALTVLFSPTNGLVFKWWQKRNKRTQILREDVLKALYKLTFHQPAQYDALSVQLHMGLPAVRKAVSKLKSRDLVTVDGNGILLTPGGKKIADDLVRAHRLWESYLVQEFGLKQDQIHEEAEQLEHILTSHQVDAVDRHLGYPSLDPHGSPIPGRNERGMRLLEQMDIREKGKIAHRQPSVDIPYKLWALGIGPGEEFELLKKQDSFTIRTSQDEIEIAQSLARRIRIEPA